MPRGGGDQQLYYFGRNLHDHIAASVANVEGVQPPFLERAVHYDGLSRELAASLTARSRDIALEALQAANRDAHKACETDVPGEWRWNFGVYVYSERVEPPPLALAPKTDGEEPTS